MNRLIPISYLNDFLFCPYSIYLHQIYGGTEEETVKALPQKAGTAAHKKIESETEGRPGVLRSLPVLSESLGIYGVIDEYDMATGTITEYKNHIKSVFPGQKIQLQAQCICLMEEGMIIHEIRLRDISEKKDYPISIPNKDDIKRIEGIIRQIMDYNPGHKIETNPNKCIRCIYCPLCEKTNQENDF